MRNRTLATASLLILFNPLIGNAGLFEPSDYHECIMESMKGVTNDVAARVIASSCREKFPKKTLGRKGAPSLEEWLKEAGYINPGHSEHELTGYWYKKYGPSSSDSSEESKNQGGTP